MQHIVTLKNWMRRAYRTRAASFLRFLLKRFFEENWLLTAGALSYTTLLALVPLAATALGVIAMFPIYQRWGDALTIFLFDNFVPKAAASVADYIRTFATGARGMTGIGALGVLASAFLTMSSIEDAFNKIWRVPTSRSPHARFLLYCAALALGPLLAVLSLAISSYVFSLPLIAEAEQTPLAKYGLRLVPGLLELIAFTAAYKVIPHRSVRLWHAFVGGILATILFEGAKYVVAYYLIRASYQQIYGALALVPIFLLWIWVSWLVILLGAILAAALSVYRYRPQALRLPKGFEFYGLLRLLGRFEEARVQGKGLHSVDLHALEPILADDALQDMMRALCQIGVLQRDKAGEWSLARDLDEVGFGEVYEGTVMRIPDADVLLPCRDDALGIRVNAALDALRVPLRDGLRRTVGSIYRPSATDPPGSNQAAASNPVLLHLTGCPSAPIPTEPPVPNPSSPTQSDKVRGNSE